MAFTTIVRALTVTETIDQIKQHILMILNHGGSVSDINTAMTAAGYDTGNVTTAANELVSEGKITYT